MIMGKHTRKAVALVGVLAAALVGATAVGLWGGPAGPASTDTALVDPAAAMDADGGVCIGDSSEDFASVALPGEDDLDGRTDHFCWPVQGCRQISSSPCCYLCGGPPVCLD